MAHCAVGIMAGIFKPAMIHAVMASVIFKRAGICGVLVSVHSRRFVHAFSHEFADVLCRHAGNDARAHLSAALDHQSKTAFLSWIFLVSRSEERRVGKEWWSR